jgi:hypothetical protein
MPFPKPSFDLSHRVFSICGFYVFSFFAFFLLLHDGRYRLDDADDSLFTSYAWNYLHRGIEYDAVSGLQHDLVGVQNFGKTFSWLLGKSLDLLGWSKANAHLLPLLFLLAALVVWWILLKAMGVSTELASAFASGALLLEPFFSTAICARGESFVFFMSSLSALFFLKKHYFFSTLSLCLGLETHPAGLVALFYIAAILWAFPEFRKSFRSRTAVHVGAVLLGLAVGAAYYFYLHGSFISNLPGILVGGDLKTRGKIPNFLFEYYFRTRYFRHLPELAAMMACTCLYWKRGFHRLEKFPSALLVACLCFTLVVRHPNAHYAVYVYPAFLLLALRLAEWEGRLAWALAGIGLFMIPQYAYLYGKTRQIDFPRQVEVIRRAVPADGLPVMGSPNEWYSFYDRDFYVDSFRLKETPLFLPEFYLVKGPEIDDYLMGSENTKEWLARNYDPKFLRKVALTGLSFSTYLETAKTRPHEVVSDGLKKP